MKDLDYNKIGMRIRQARREKGWSQDELAKKCGISMSFLGHIERGTRIMSLDTFVSICSALDVGADGLLWDTVRICDSAFCLPEQNHDFKEMDSYSMYVKIMKSVAEILSEPTEAVV